MKAWYNASNFLHENGFVIALWMTLVLAILVFLISMIYISIILKLITVSWGELMPILTQPEFWIVFWIWHVSSPSALLPKVGNEGATRLSESEQHYFSAGILFL